MRDGCVYTRAYMAASGKSLANVSPLCCALCYSTTRVAYAICEIFLAHYVACLDDFANSIGHARCGKTEARFTDVKRIAKYFP